jgi:hypothetical protein
MSNENAEKQRKQRSDKGLVMATKRDLYCIAWIADQYVIRADQVQRLLSRFPDKEKPFKNGKTPALTTTKDQISRWRRAGWVDYRRVLADEPGYMWCTKKGLALVGRDDYTAREPASTRLNHLFAVNQLRLWMDFKFAWKSERRYRADLSKQEIKKGDVLGPIPDGLLITKDGVIALEVEISPKKPADLEQKLIRLARHIVSDGLGYRSAFSTIWFYTPNEQIKTLVESCYEVLTDDERARVSVGIEKDLLASKYR